MDEIKDITWEENVSLKNYNTYKIEAKCQYLIKVLSIDGLINCLKYLKEHNISYFILGNGSNVILDDYFKGAIIKLDGLNKIKIQNNLIEVEAGCMMNTLASTTVDNNLTGLEWAINIPGTIGGSIVGNAGAYNSDIFANLIKVTILDNNLNIIEINKEDIIYSYRKTNLKDKGIVLKAYFKLNEGNRIESLELMKTRCEKRIASQPLNLPSAGSVFRNPDGDYAGRLIEEAGLKGKTIGGAQISNKHANFIVNIGGATSQDIKNLIKLVQSEVKKKFDVDLILEQNIIDWK